MSSSHDRLQGRTALVTGGGAGIGRGIALALASEGANVIVAARRAATGDQTAALIAQERGVALCVQCDVSMREDVDRAISAGLATFGGLDIVVSNAFNCEGVRALAIEEIAEANWHAQASVAWDAAYFLAQACLPHLKRSSRSSFVVLGSLDGLHGAAWNPVYSALKGGIRGFVKALAREWGPYQITVNAIEPVAAAEPTPAASEREREAFENYRLCFPMGRVGRPREDIGRAVAALCSDAFGFVTAQSIQADGGLFTAV